MALLLLIAGGAAVFQWRKRCAAPRAAAGGHAAGVAAQSEALSAGAITVPIDGVASSSLNQVELGVIVDTSGRHDSVPIVIGHAIGAADPWADPPPRYT